MLYNSLSFCRVVGQFANPSSGIYEVLPKIFDPFFTTKRGQGGTGLGLNIVFNLITQTLGGSIDVTSAAGEGTTFTITTTR